ncbi:MAG: hypothetical protein JXA52_07000 [Planctomycetes bacterium]|nr:hypothetical protein [Planctomycetota bacterium]
MVVRLGAGLFILIVTMALGAGSSNLVAEELCPTLKIESVPDIVFSDQAVQVRIATGFDREPPLRQLRRITNLTPAEVTAVLTIPGEKDTPLEVVPSQLEIPPYNDTSLPLRFAISQRYLQTEGRIRITLKTSYCEVEATIALRRGQSPGEDLFAQGAHLYTQDGARVMLTVDRYGEASYRRWAVPKAILRSLTLPPDEGVVYLTTYSNNGKKILPAMNHNSSSPPNGKLGILREEFSAAKRKLRIIAPAFNNNAPALGLLAEAGRFLPEGETAIMIDPGIEDILFGTPVALYKNVLHALVSRIEGLYPPGTREIFLIIPAPPAGLSGRGEAYVEAATKVARERHLSVMPAPRNSGRDQAFLYPTNEARRDFTRNLILRTQVSSRRGTFYLTVGVLLVALVAFIIVQVWNRRRLRKLVEFTCSEE